MWLRSSRVATRIWWTESHSLARTLGSYSMILSRLACSAAMTAAAAEPGSTVDSRMFGGSGTLSTESPSAVASFDGDLDGKAPAAMSASEHSWSRFTGAGASAAGASAAWAAASAATPVSSTSHSRQRVSLPAGRKDLAVTWSSQNSATGLPSGSA